MRQKAYDVLTSSTTVTNLVSDRVYAANSYEGHPDTPFIVYKVGTETPRNVPARNTPLEVWIHDQPGSYSQVDTLVEEVKTIFEDAPPESNFFAAEWLDSSEDRFDDVLGTIYRTVRFQLVNKEV